jgi:hypothetical protein
LLCGGFGPSKDRRRMLEHHSTGSVPCQGDIN